jgi:hypothetical protein
MPPCLSLGGQYSTNREPCEGLKKVGGVHAVSCYGREGLPTAGKGTASNARVVENEGEHGEADQDPQVIGVDPRRRRSHWAEAEGDSQ